MGIREAAAAVAEAGLVEVEGETTIVETLAGSSCTMISIIGRYMRVNFMYA